MAFESTSELLTLLQEEVNDTSPSATTQARYLNLLDAAHKAIVSGGGELNLDDSSNPIRRPFLFPWALSKKPLIVTLLPKQTGSLNVTNGSPSLTIDIDSSSTDLTDYHIKIDNSDEVYRINTHSGFAVTLDGIYLGETNVSAAYEAFKLSYTIDASPSEILLPVDKFRGFKSRNTQYTVSITDLPEVLDRYPLARVQEENPKFAGILQQTETQLCVQFNSYPKEAQRLEFWYIPQPADLNTSGSNPIIPKHHRRVIVHLAAFYHLRKRDDDRARSHFETAKRLFDALTTEARQILGGNDRFFAEVIPFPGGFDTIESGNLIEVDLGFN